MERNHVARTALWPAAALALLNRSILNSASPPRCLQLQLHPSGPRALLSELFVLNTARLPMPYAHRANSTELQ